MTEEESRPRSAVLTEAFDRAVMAGLRLRQPDEGQRSVEVVCPLCHATVTIPRRPWRPSLVARRLDAFALRHIDHDRPDTEVPGPPNPAEDT